MQVVYSDGDMQTQVSGQEVMTLVDAVLIWDVFTTVFCTPDYVRSSSDTTLKGIAPLRDKSDFREQAQY